MPPEEPVYINRDSVLIYMMCCSTSAVVLCTYRPDLYTSTHQLINNITDD